MAEETGNNNPEYSAKWWQQEVKESEKYLDDKWRKAADRVVKRYLDERDGDNGAAGGALPGTDDSSQRKYNIFWANVQIIKSALYATAPKPAIKRQHDDAKDDVARVAAMILERIINFGLDRDGSDMHDAFQAATEDLLIPGLGQVWLRYDVETTEFDIPEQKTLAGDVLVQASKGQRITNESAPCDYVHWRDFLFSVCRRWNDKWWVGKRCYLKKKAFVKRFGEEKWKLVQDQTKMAREKNSTLPKNYLKSRAEVLELWCEDTNRVYWVSPFLEECLDEKSDPLKLERFYPCPHPLMATHTTSFFYPRSDFTMVADQYEELDTLNSRIAILTKALRVVGVYDKTNSELKQLLSGGEFNMIPVDNWAVFGEAGGLKGAVDWFPVDVVADVLKGLLEIRPTVIQQIYELTSISDIMRGASNPRDTLGAQKLKAQYSSVRLQLRQQDVGMFVREAIQIKCEIICKHWQPDTIRHCSQIDQTETGQTRPDLVEGALELLKSYHESQYRIEVSEQALSIADYNAEREMRTELLTAIGQFLSQSAQMMEAYPPIATFLFQTIQWVIASFRASQDIETVIDEAIKTVQQNPPQGQKEGGGGPDNNPGQIANAQAKMQVAQLQGQVKQLEMQLKKQMNDDNNQTKVLIEEMKQGQDDKHLQQEAIGMTLESSEQAEARAQEQQNIDSQQEHEARMTQQSQQHEKGMAQFTAKTQSQESAKDRDLAAKTAKAKQSQPKGK